MNRKLYMKKKILNISLSSHILKEVHIFNGGFDNKENNSLFISAYIINYHFKHSYIIKQKHFRG